MTAALRALGFGNVLGVRLVIASLIIGSVLSVFATALQLAISFAQQKSDAVTVLNRVEQVVAGPLEHAVWTFNVEQVDILIDGLFSDPNIARVTMTTTTGQIWTRGETAADGTPDVARSYDLVHTFEDGRAEVVGRLDIELTLDVVRARIWAQLWTTLLSNLLKAYLAAGALLFLVETLVSRHLRKVADHVDHAGPSPHALLSLDRRKPARSDDLDRITEAVNQFEARISSQMASLTREVDDRKRAETEARDALSLRSRFLATMSHEIRTPLNAIMGFLHLIETQDDASDKVKLYAQTATKASHQLMGLMNNSLDMSRIEANAIDIRVAPSDVRELAQAWHQNALAACHMRGKDIDVTLSLGPDLPESVVMDASHVSRIVGNLVDNAIKFTDQGRVDIAVDRAGPTDADGLDIRVSDTGCGIPDEAKAAVFERFNQAENGMVRAYGGSGLGLAISRELALLMGAHLTVSAGSKGDGFSTVFLLSLQPAAEAVLAS